MAFQINFQEVTDHPAAAAFVRAVSPVWIIRRGSLDTVTSCPKERQDRLKGAKRQNRVAQGVSTGHGTQARDGGGEESSMKEAKRTGLRSKKKIDETSSLKSW